MKDTPNVVAVVVTYNRKQWLFECLNSLINQSTPLSKIIVLDNNSSDGTWRDLQLYCRRHNNIDCYFSQHNLGSAGGYAQALHYAFAENSEWIWFLDDDVEAVPDALTNLLLSSDGAICVHGTRYRPNGAVFSWGGNFDPVNITFKPDTQAHNPNFVINSYNVCCFEGALINSDSLRRTGFIDPALFIAWDDTYLGYKLSKLGVIRYVDKPSLVRKRDVAVKSKGLFKGVCQQNKLFAYYWHRNRFYLQADMNSSFTSRFVVSSIAILIKSLVRSLIVFPSFEITKATVKGYIDGVMYLSQCKNKK